MCGFFWVLAFPSLDLEGVSNDLNWVAANGGPWALWRDIKVLQAIACPAMVEGTLALLKARMLRPRPILAAKATTWRRHHRRRDKRALKTGAQQRKGRLWGLNKNAYIPVLTFFHELGLLQAGSTFTGSRLTSRILAFHTQLGLGADGPRVYLNPSVPES
jgi:hypothetical protein